MIMIKEFLEYLVRQIKTNYRFKSNNDQIVEEHDATV